jgi:hypothetical protein
MTTTLNASTAGAGGFIATSDNSGSLALQTAGTTAITVDTSQNVGIGTTSPNGKLEISGSSTFIPTTTITADNAVTGWRVRRTGGTYQREYYMGMRENSTALDFYDNTADALRMRINTSGNLCVGTTSNIARIGAVFDGNTDNGCVLRTSTNASGTGFLYFQQDTTTCGSVVRVGTTSAVTYASTSDYRLKENVTPMTGALSKVARLKPVTYTWKSGGESAEGFIAHELAEVCPDAVVGTKDELDKDGNPKYQAIDTSFLVATLTAALQETKALIDTQSETLTQQTEAINALTARIVALETA